MTNALIVLLLIIGCGGIALWLKGYKNPTHVPSDLPFEHLAILISPPRLLYFVCGLPKSPDYPKGIMSAWAFSAQLMGLFFVIHVSLYLFPNKPDNFIDLIILIVLINGFTYWLTKNRAYRPRRNRITK